MFLLWGKLHPLHIEVYLPTVWRVIKIIMSPKTAIKMAKYGILYSSGEVGESNIAVSAWNSAALNGKSHPTYLCMHLFRPCPASTLQELFSGAFCRNSWVNIPKQRRSPFSICATWYYPRYCCANTAYTFLILVKK